MFKSIVVALDLEAGGDRALPVAAALAAAGGLPVSLLTVSSPHLSETQDRYELSQRAAAYGWPAEGCTVAHDNHPARAIVQDLESRDRALLVMATSAKSSTAAQFLGGVTEDVLGLIKQPIVLVGPRVPAEYELGDPTPVACIERDDVAEAAVPAIVAWTRTFGGAEPALAEVSPSPVEPGQPSLVDTFAALLAAEGITGARIPVGGSDAESWIDDLGRHVANPIVVSTSVRWTDKHARGRSMTRRLVQRSPWPALVVPARYAPWRSESAPPAADHEMSLEAFEELDEAACWSLAGAAQVGRLAVCIGGSPRIFPINFVVDEGTIVFRTAAGSKLAASKDAEVAFEVDEYDLASGHATSVIIEGQATEITEAAEWDRALELPLFPWHVAPKGHFVRIVPSTISGRRFRAAYAAPPSQR